MRSTTLSILLALSALLCAPVAARADAPECEPSYAASAGQKLAYGFGNMLYSPVVIPGNAVMEVANNAAWQAPFRFVMGWGTGQVHFWARLFQGAVQVGTFPATTPAAYCTRTFSFAPDNKTPEQRLEAQAELERRRAAFEAAQRQRQQPRRQPRTRGSRF